MVGNGEAQLGCKGPTGQEEEWETTGREGENMDSCVSSFFFRRDFGEKSLYFFGPHVLICIN